VVTVSDTRSEADDRGGAIIVELLQAAGHEVTAREVIPDEPSVISEFVQQLEAQGDVQAILLTGGTGIAPRDNTVDVVTGLLTKTLPGYGELFRMLSFEEIGPAAMLSRACGGVVASTVVLTMPGSPAAVRLAMERLILPELAHLVAEATKG
jgi:molybdenum cofactor biosynthesis protein B